MGKGCFLLQVVGKFSLFYLSSKFGDIISSSYILSEDSLTFATNTKLEFAFPSPASAVAQSQKSTIVASAPQHWPVFIEIISTAH